MATIKTSIFLAFLVFSSLLFYCSKVNGGGETERSHAVSVRTLLPESICSTSQGFHQRGLTIVHRHGPCSSLAQDNQTRNDILLQDESRVQWLRSRLSTDSRSVQGQDTSILKYPGRSLGAGYYTVAIGFGTPTKKFSMLFDTGSDITWIQCQPCVVYCYPQIDPVFDPSHSSSYHNISCNSPECSQLRQYGCQDSTCIYGVWYGDNSSTVGFFAKETLTLTPNDVFQNFKFGCGEQNRVHFGPIAGIIGLGQGSVSLVSQTAEKFRKVFSYCFPPTTSSRGYLSFGPIKNSSGVAYTSIITNPRAPALYFVDLVGIRLAESTLQIPRPVFSSLGTVIDSGTAFTRLPRLAYTILRSAFRQSMSQYPLLPKPGFLDTCYDLSRYTTVEIPKISLLYEGGVSMDLDASGIIYAESPSKVCLAFLASEDIGVIGNVQQRTFEVVYDVAMRRIGFRPGAC